MTLNRHQKVLDIQDRMKDTVRNQALYPEVYKCVRLTPTFESTCTSDGRIFAQVKVTGGKLTSIIISSETDLARLEKKGFFHF